MENEIVKIELTVAQWNQILGVVSLAPYQVVNQINDTMNHLQSQAGPQIEAAIAKHAAPEAAETAE